MAPRRAAQAEYRAYVQQVGGADQAGRLEFGPEDRPLTISQRLRAVAKATGVELEIKRRGNMVEF